jgi:hypothetical protein
MSAIGINGQTIQVGDQITAFGRVTAQSGVGPTAQMTIETQWSPNTFLCQANDCNSNTHTFDASHTAQAFNGGQFYGVGDQVSVLGTCVAISGSSLSVVLVTSQTTVAIPSRVRASAAAFGGTQ